MENQNTTVISFFFSNRAVYVKMWEKKEYIVTFSLPHLLGEGATTLRHTYVACLVIFNVLTH
jgi:hypothetical protein